ncbi:MAG: F0F1 ATP synthase subunit A [Bacteroidaceae bacterium]|nr:F0F1 ATP synthase subunit A [Bacteroidaceae bacterium]
MTKYKFILLAFVLCLLGSLLPVQASSHTHDEDKPIDVKEIIFDHIGDAYEWHVTTIGDKHVSIPLPVIVFSREKGFHAFLSNRLHHGEAHNGFHIATEGAHKGKVVETTSEGEVVRPLLDLSLTKIAAGIVINSLLLVAIILCVSRWYRRREASDEAPRGFVGMMEMLIMAIYDGIIKPSVGKDYERFAPYLLTAFFFIFLSNLMGLVPFFPGGANVTGNIAITLFLAVCTFLAINLFGTREYWREVLWPDVPLWMKCPVPLMPVIEIFGLITKPFALTIRLLANIMAGHSVILALVCIIFITHSMGALLGGSMTVVSVLFTIFMNFLELLVAFIQAYVFTMLSAVFIGLSRVEHHKK